MVTGNVGSIVVIKVVERGRTALAGGRTFLKSGATHLLFRLVAAPHRETPYSTRAGQPTEFGIDDYEQILLIKAS